MISLAVDNSQGNQVSFLWRIGDESYFSGSECTESSDFPAKTLQPSFEWRKLGREKQKHLSFDDSSGVFTLLSYFYRNVVFYLP